MAKKNYTPKRDKDGKFKNSSHKNAPEKKSSVKKSVKKMAKTTKPPKQKVEAVLPPPVAVETKVSKKMKETFVDVKEEVQETVQKAWNKYTTTISGSSTSRDESVEKIIDPNEDSECYMGLYYQIVEDQKHRIKLRVWNQETGSWNNFTLNMDPTLSQEARKEDIRQLLLSAMKASKKAPSARRDIPAARSSV
jgi:hypothetical protein